MSSRADIIIEYLAEQSIITISTISTARICFGLWNHLHDTCTLCQWIVLLYTDTLVSRTSERTLHVAGMEHHGLFHNHLGHRVNLPCHDLYSYRVGWSALVPPKERKLHRNNIWCRGVTNLEIPTTKYAVVKQERIVDQTRLRELDICVAVGEYLATYKVLIVHQALNVPLRLASKLV